MKLLPRNFIGRFICLILLWLPVWLALWYIASGVLAAPAVWIASLGINLFQDGLIDDLVRQGHQFTLITKLMVEVPDAPPGALGQIMVEKNPLLYTWNLPLLMALLFAADERFFSMSRMFLTYVLLLPFQAFGIAFDVIKTLAFETGPDVTVQLGFEPWQMNAIALGYQFGYLMLPFIAAAGIWILMNRALLESLRNEGLPERHP